MRFFTKDTLRRVLINNVDLIALYGAMIAVYIFAGALVLLAALIFG